MGFLLLLLLLFFCVFFGGGGGGGLLKGMDYAESKESFLLFSIHRFNLINRGHNDTGRFA